MQQIKQASILSQKAQVYKKQGNHDYSRRCYIKIVSLLSLALKQCNGMTQIQDIKHKIKKYNKLAQEAELLMNNGRNSKPIVSKFGFPQQKQINMNLFEQKPKQTNINNNSNKIIKQLQNNNNNNNNNNFQIKKQINIPSQISKFIIENIKITFDDIVGMKSVKKILIQTVIRPKKRPDLCQGIRSPAKGILLYGPPGNGKTYIGKALANQSNSTFIALSSSAIMNKFVGEAEKTLRKIFEVAYQLSPTIIFIDEIDSLLTARSQNQNQASRRIKTEFLVILDGISNPKSGNVLLIGATNLPDQIDMAARRRFEKHIYVGLPEKQFLEEIIYKNLKEVQYNINKSQMKKIINMLEGYSASQITNLIKAVCMLPLSQLTQSQFQSIKKKDLRKICLKDFENVIKQRPPLLRAKDLQRYQKYQPT